MSVALSPVGAEVQALPADVEWLLSDEHSSAVTGAMWPTTARRRRDGHPSIRVPKESLRTVRFSAP
jgi:hypothetical protein